jgi:hypothetical protein
MADVQRVIEEARPMLEDFLIDIGLHSAGTPLDVARLLEAFSSWLDKQEIGEQDHVFLASRSGWLWVAAAANHGQKWRSGVHLQPLRRDGVDQQQRPGGRVFAKQ